MGESSSDNRRHQQAKAPHEVERAEPIHTRPYWQRAHRDWRFWFGVASIAAALLVFIFSDNLALVPRPH